MMRNNYLFKTFFLLCAMLVGSVANAADKWVKTAPADLATGDVVVIVDQTSKCAMQNNNGTSSAPAATPVTLSDDLSEITSNVAETLQWEVTVSDDSYQFAVGDHYLYCTNTNNGVRVGSNENNTFTIYDKDGVNFLLNTATSRYIGVYNSQDWRCYTSINANIRDCVTAFYKKTAGVADTRTETQMTLGDGYAITGVAGETLTLPTASVMAATAEVEGAEITWTSTNTEVATIEGNQISLLKAGTTAITASFAGDNDYQPCSASYELTVTADTNVPGMSAENPYTVAQAIAAINEGSYDANTEYYIKGYVSSFYNTSIMGDGNNFRYYISDDGTTDGQLLVYKGKGLNNEAFTNTDDLLIGDEVIICGNLTIYNKAPEINKDNYIVSLNRAEDNRAETMMSIGGDPETTGVAGETLSLPTATVLVLNVEVKGLEITWSSSDETVATIEADGIHLLKAGTTAITASFAGNNDYKPCSDSYELTVTAKEEEPISGDKYIKVTSTSNIKSGRYLIVCEDYGVAFNGGLETLDAVSNTIDVNIVNAEIAVTDATTAAEFNINVTDGTIKAANGLYIGVSSNSNGLKTTDEAATYTHSFTIDEDNNAVISAIFEESTMTLRYNNASNQNRFRYYKTGQKPVQLYIYTEPTPTAIQTVERKAAADGVVYNLAGQRVENATKGLYIVNGRKVVVK